MIKFSTLNNQPMVEATKSSAVVTSKNHDESFEQYIESVEVCANKVKEMNGS